MDIFSKIKKFEEADYFNQNLSNVLIDEDRDKFTIGHELIEESDYFNSNLSNVLIDEDRDKFTIGHELIEESDYFNSNLTNVLLDTSSDIFADSLVLNDEETDFFNQNLSNALIEDVDLDSIVDTLSLVETANEQNAVKYYKVEITKTPSTYTTATLSNGRFNGLRFKETTSTFETNAISENVVFTDSNNHDINAVVEYLNGRTESNNNSYNPSAFFVEDASQSWGGTPWNTIEGDSNEDLVYRITFQTKIQRSDIESLTFNDINDDNVPVKFKLFVSNDLETWELLDNTTLSFNTDDNEYYYDSTNVHHEGKYKIVLTSYNDVNKTSQGVMGDGKFEHLTYVECLSPRSATATSENIVFSDDDGNTYNCTVSISSRWWYDNGVDDYAPHNLFALEQSQRVAYSTYITSNSRSAPLTVTIKFTDDIKLELLQGLTIRYGQTFRTASNAKYANYALYDEDDNLLYHEENVNENLTDFNNSGQCYTLTYYFDAYASNQDDVNHKFKIEFTNLTVGQYINFIATSITGLEFYENRITNRKTDIVKVYKDTEGNEFPVHIYVVPSVDHNYWGSNGFDDVYFYKANTSSSDKIVIEFDTLINNINAIGKTIHFEAPGDQSHNNFTLNVYADDTLLYSDTRLFDMAVDVEIKTDSQN